MSIQKSYLNTSTYIMYYQLRNPPSAGALLAGDYAPWIPVSLPLSQYATGIVKIDNNKMFF